MGSPREGDRPLARRAFCMDVLMLRRPLSDKRHVMSRLETSFPSPAPPLRTLPLALSALALVLMQACGTKPKEKAQEGLDATAAKLNAEDKAALEKREAIAKREAAQKERLRVAAERRAAEQKTYKDNFLKRYEIRKLPPYLILCFRVRLSRLDLIDSSHARF